MRPGAGGRVILLGPQRRRPALREAVSDLAPEGPIALVTAGWEEREGEDGELREHVGREVRNLEVYGRGEDVFRRDPELFEAMRGRYDTMRRLQELYRMRLRHAMAAARELLARAIGADGTEGAAEGPGGPMDGEEALVSGECEAAIEAVRALDVHHLGRVAELNQAFEERWKPWERDAVARHREELRRRLTGAAVLAVAGGHVAILRSRLRLLGVGELWGGGPVVAWSAGAMALSPRVVLFHDSPPQGPGDAEVLQEGLGVFRGIVPLPHASRRLRLDDPVRVGLLARRFRPDACLTLDPGARIDCALGEAAEQGFAASGEVVLRLTPEGALQEVGGR